MTHHDKNNCSTCPVGAGTHKPAEAVHQIEEPKNWDSPLSDFQEGQWWVQELDKIANTSANTPIKVTHDMKRAVSVVHHMLRAARNQDARVAELERWQEEVRSNSPLLAELRRLEEENAALKAAPAAQAVEPTDAELIALNVGECFFSESPSKYPEYGHGTQYHAGAPGVIAFARAVLALRTQAAATQALPATHTAFQLGQLARKKSGSEWEGHVCGWYSTELTPEGYAVESSTHTGSVQIYPAKALEAVAPAITTTQAQDVQRDAELIEFIEAQRDVRFSRCREGSINGPIRWDVEMGHHGVEVRAPTLAEAIRKAIAASAAQGANHG